MKLLVCILLSISFTGCTRSSPVINAYLPNLLDKRPAVIFVHGFYGASLREKSSGKKFFYSLPQALFGKSAMSLHQEELGTPRGPELEVEGLFGSVPVVPILYELDVYNGLIKNLRAMHGESQILPLVYDWRQDLFPAVGKLDELVKRLQEKGVPQISILAHSMGGLVTSYYLGYGNQPIETAKLNWAGAKRVQRVVFFGVPFSGSMIAFRSFEKGSGLPQSQRMLNAETMSSFPALYQLLPATAQVIDEKGEKQSLPLFDPAVWKKHRFGLLRGDHSTEAHFSARERFTEEQVKRAKRWYDLVQLGRSEEWPAPKSLQVLNVVSSQFDTLDRAYFSSGSGNLLFDPEEVLAAGKNKAALYQAGDGTVTLASAEAPAALRSVTKVVHSDYSHEKLFLDPKVETEYNHFLQPPKE